ncbi:MAG: hypothetical protein RI897_2686 [Verrucomicrobiota bacterium]
MAGVVFDTGAEAHFEHHFDVILCAHFDALGFEEFSVFFEKGDTFGEFLLDCAHGTFNVFHGGNELFAGEDGNEFEVFDTVAGEGVDTGEAVDGFAEELDAEGVFGLGGVDLDRIAADAELAAFEGDVVAGVLEVDESGEELFA